MPARASSTLKLEYADWYVDRMRSGAKQFGKTEWARKKKVSTQTLRNWEKSEEFKLRVAALTGERPIESQYVEAFEKCVADPAYFIDNYCMMWEKEGGDPIPFELWDCQRETLDLIERERQVIILKTRQLGESWTMCAYSLWKCMFTSNVHIYIRSIGLKEANEQHERLKFMYDNLPEWLQARVRLGGKNLKRNDSVSQFSNGSSVHMLSASKKSGHGAAPTLIFWDEMARDELADPYGWRAIKPAVNGGGRVVLVSSSDGPNNRFAKVWQAAVKGENKFVPVFFPWSAHPERDQEWYDEERAAWEAEGDIEGFFQAYPSSPSEAFAAASRCPFDGEAIRALASHAEQPVKGELFADEGFMEKVGGRLHVWRKPVAGQTYTLGVDPAMGLKRDGHGLHRDEHGRCHVAREARAGGGRVGGGGIRPLVQRGVRGHRGQPRRLRQDHRGRPQADLRQHLLPRVPRQAVGCADPRARVVHALEPEA